MIEKDKPQAQNLGRLLLIDDESMYDNVIKFERQEHKQYVFGISAPEITTLDILEHELLPEMEFVKSMSAADSHLRSMGLPPIHKPADLLIYHRFIIKQEIVHRYRVSL
jgi:hypothetical protein